MPNPTVDAGGAVRTEQPTAVTQVQRWRAIAVRYHTREASRAFLELAVTLLPLFGLLVLMYKGMHVSYWITLALAPVAAGFLLRTFVLMHDCAHGSFLPWRRANEIVGTITGILTMTPFAVWRRDHALHHASSGDLDRRGHGDIQTWTVREYNSHTRFERLKYRLYRNPVIMFGLGPIYLLINERKTPSGVSVSSAGASSAWVTNIMIAALVAAMSFAIGFGAVIKIYFPIFIIAGAAGIWLFYVQHQFEDTYWEPHHEWDYSTAAMRGSSYFRLPRVFEWLTGHIGLHHVHHFDPRIASYNLGKCYRENSEFRCATVLGLRDSFRTMSLKLWDEEQRRLTGFAAAQRAALGESSLSSGQTAH